MNLDLRTATGVVTSSDTPRHIDHLRIDDLIAAERNPRVHNLDAIRRSIGQFGFVDPAEMDERTGRLVAGHGRAAALRAMRDDGETAPAGVLVDEDGAWRVPVVRGWASRSDAEAAAYLTANNRMTELARWDQQGLADMLTDINTVDPVLMEAAGYDQDDLADILKRLEPDDLDDLAGEHGDPDPSDMWPTITVRKVPPHVAAAWRECVSAHSDDEIRAIATLLEIDPEPPPTAAWRP